VSAIADGQVTVEIVMLVPLVIMALIACPALIVALMEPVIRESPAQAFAIAKLDGLAPKLDFVTFVLLDIMAPTVRPALIVALMEPVIRELVEQEPAFAIVDG